MSSKNRTQQELDKRDRRMNHNRNNQKNAQQFKKLKRRRHGVGKHRT